MRQREGGCVFTVLCDLWHMLGGEGVAISDDWACMSFAAVAMRYEELSE